MQVSAQGGRILVVVVIFLITAGYGSAGVVRTQDLPELFSMAQQGDIILYGDLNLIWHAMIVADENFLVEAHSDSLFTRKIPRATVASRAHFEKIGYAFLVHVDALKPEHFVEAAGWAINQTEHRTPYCPRVHKNDTTRHYSSHLVWQAYHYGPVDHSYDIDADGGIWVTPMDILLDDDAFCTAYWINEGDTFFDDFETGAIDTQTWLPQGDHTQVTTEFAHSGDYGLRLHGADHVGGGSGIRTIKEWSADSIVIDVWFRDIALTPGGGTDGNVNVYLGDENRHWMAHVTQELDYGDTIFIQFDGEQRYFSSVDITKLEGWHLLRVKYRRDPSASTIIVYLGNDTKPPVEIVRCQSTDKGRFKNFLLYCSGQYQNIATGYFDDIHVYEE